MSFFYYRDDDVTIGTFMSVQGYREDLVNLTSIAAPYGPIVNFFYHIEPDLYIPGNIPVDLNKTVATITPEGDVEYVYGWIGAMVPGYKSEFVLT